MAGRHALRRPGRHMISDLGDEIQRWLEEWEHHDELGCKPTCLESHHGGRHAGRAAA